MVVQGARVGPEEPGGLTTTNAKSASAEQAQETEADLLRRMQADDLDAFEAFFIRYRTSIYRTAYGLTGDPHVAEEVPHASS